ncbi:hypothetical protein [Bacterioplanoides pacificum]|uniref:DUF306 domain-containing protein n=1 Tax=Bacterioplanoides pacificum TaxID=1171596 RepID=A0ABV7VPD2_9GAMM
MRILILTACLTLGGCIAEDDPQDIINDQGDSVSDQTLSLSGFWDGQFNQSTDIRMLIYNGNVYALDGNNGYYGTVSLNSGDQTALINATAYALNSASDSTAEQLIADGNDAAYVLDTQLSSLFVSNDSLFGSYSIDGTSSGNIKLTRDGTWSNNSPLSALTVVGSWSASNHELVMTRAGSGVTFTGVSTATGNSGCNFRGRLETIDSNYNLYRAVLSSREDCPAFNNSATGYAGFNSEGELEFYLRANNALLFMTFAPPAGQSGGDSSGDAGDGETETPAEGDGEATAE